MKKMYGGNNLRKFIPLVDIPLLGNKNNLLIFCGKVNFGSKKQKEKVDKETKKFRKFLKISNMKNNDEDEKYEGDINEGDMKKKMKGISGMTRIDYKIYDIKIQEINKNFENKIKKIFDTCLQIDFFNNISILKDKKNIKLCDVAQVVIKSSNLIYFYPYTINDIQKIIHNLKLKDNTWNPTVSNDGQYVILQIQPLSEDVKMKKKKEAKDLFEKIKNDIRNVRYKIRDDIIKNIEGDQWKIVERNKLDNYIKDKMKLIENVYEQSVKNY
ncbi:hypothetical protein PFUGPA_00555 [Plasmodium falciparum Palo Alto/Uganda]|nr:hypothetical protein PFFVO_00825 [Plasmodium falciparum Vietnam Oak-Knoll (FVO)]ETW44692.1 hypothetical protein PFNF135_00904 [Plasmodium falciparum NF135/5.C10]ETW57481.1 hypothetical protein PFUGPA_00555 [Plasmodium falciparum Palo Alto/Uganda]ETW63282.1 hypothetical protein PFMC_00852 [Plasmodium falciparum CAMP/Malaysia]EWC89916.1 hypothetical protein PFNF54_01042 [Plasmodium falciparum NF54]